MTNYQFSKITEKGFTLIELVVVLGLFLLIMGVTVSMFISIIGHQKRILSQQEMLNQVSYLQEHLSAALRNAKTDTTGDCLAQDGAFYKGYVYLLTHDDAASGFYQGVKFLSSQGVCQEFFLNADGVLQEIKDGQLPQYLVSPKFQIPYVRFVVNGNKNLRAVAGGTVQPRIGMVISLKDPAQEASPQTIIQTTISQR